MSNSNEELRQKCLEKKVTLFLLFFALLLAIVVVALNVLEKPQNLETDCNLTKIQGNDTFFYPVAVQEVNDRIPFVRRDFSTTEQITVDFIGEKERTVIYVAENYTKILCLLNVSFGINKTKIILEINQSELRQWKDARE